MKSGTLLAFPESTFQGRNLRSIKPTFLRVNGDPYLGIPFSRIDEMCQVLAISPEQVVSEKTSKDDIYLGRIIQKYNLFTRFFRLFRILTDTFPEIVDPETLLRRKYAKLCGYKQKIIKVRTLRPDVVRLQFTVEYHQKQLVASLRELEKKQSQLQIAERNNSFESFSNKFDQLLKHPDIEGIDIGYNIIEIYTKLIHITYIDRVYEIGKFKISIYVDGSHSGVRMSNLTRVVKNIRGVNCDHPHIACKVPCLGNIKEAVPRMIAAHEYNAVVAVCIQYLKSYEDSNDGHPHVKIDNWPQVKGKRQ